MTAWALFLSLLAPLIFAHGEESHEAARILPFDPLQVVMYASFIAAAFLALALLNKKVTEENKRLFFAGIALPITLATLYLGASTVYLNMMSESGGPVHWHADFEVWACGEKIQLHPSGGFDNKVGSSTLHHHDDMRIHVEGLLLEKSDASVRAFFETIGGEFHDDELSVITHDGSKKTWKRGQLCQGKPGRARLYVNCRPEPEGGGYVIAPYFNVPPGDFLIVAFEAEDSVADDYACADTLTKLGVFK